MAAEHRVEAFTLDTKVREWLTCTCGLTFTSAAAFMAHMKGK